MPEGRPLAVYAKDANAFLLTGVDACASQLGLRLAMSLADARAIQPGLTAVEAEPEEDARMLDAIADWCERFTPVVVVDAPDGLFLNITGCAHLFGGEPALQRQIVTRLQAQGFGARAAIAPTPGAAWALARYATQKTLSLVERVAAQRPGEGRSDKQAPARLNSPHLDASRRHFPQGGELVEMLAPLPISALRLEDNSVALLQRLGLKTIGQLINAPRTPFAARAGEAAMLRLDQALGRAPEALTPRRPPPPVFALRRFLEPIFTIEAVLQVAGDLCGDVIEKLDLQGAGARRAELYLFGVDGRDRVIEIAVSRPEREVKALMRLLREKLDRAAENLNMEFGLEAARLDVVELQRIDEQARTLVAVEEAAASAEKITAIADVLSARLGPARVLRAKLNDIHAPEKAGVWRKALSSPASGSRGARNEGGGSVPQDGVQRRPLSVFQRPQQIEAIATVPDGPPIRFRWRRVVRQVARAEGPERISGDWLGGAPTRDYYRVEDKDGRRYWLYREGLFGEAETPRWYVHGLFA